MDYLYEEMSVDDRAAFERAVRSHPDLQEEIAEMQATRSSLEMLPEIEVPHLVKANILREARMAVADPKKSWFDRLASLLMRPGMATAFVAVLVAGVGIFVIDRGGVFERDEQTTVLPAEDVSRTNTTTAATTPTRVPVQEKSRSFSRAASTCRFRNCTVTRLAAVPLSEEPSQKPTGSPTWMSACRTNPPV